MTGGWGIVFWVIIAAALVVIEMGTVQLVCIWFSIGALFAALACFVDAAFWLQLLIFLVSSIAVLIVGRPLFIDRLTPKKSATNADRVIGQLGVVSQEINNLAQTGRVSANGLDWTARSAYGEVIPSGATVLVLQIDGVKLIVQPLLQQEPPMPEPPPCPERQSYPLPPEQPPADPVPARAEAYQASGQNNSYPPGIAGDQPDPIPYESREDTTSPQ